METNYWALTEVYLQELAQGLTGLLETLLMLLVEGSGKDPLSCIPEPMSSLTAVALPSNHTPHPAFLFSPYSDVFTTNLNEH